MRLRWTLPAAGDLANINHYLQQQYPHLAESTVRTIYERIRSLKQYPYLGRHVAPRRNKRTGSYFVALRRGVCGKRRSD